MIFRWRFRHFAPSLRDSEGPVEGRIPSVENAGLTGYYASGAIEIGPGLGSKLNSCGCPWHPTQSAKSKSADWMKHQFRSCWSAATVDDGQVVSACVQGIRSHKAGVSLALPEADTVGPSCPISGVRSFFLLEQVQVKFFQPRSAVF